MPVLIKVDLKFDKLFKIFKLENCTRPKYTQKVICQIDI